MGFTRACCDMALVWCVVGTYHRLILIRDGAGYGIAIAEALLKRIGHRDSEHYQWDPGLPDIDALFLEWRWPISGRNCQSRPYL